MSPPWEEYNNIVRDVSGSHGQIIVLWDFDCWDALALSAEEVKQAYTHIISQHLKSVLMLNHETHDRIAFDIIPFVIEQFKINGYRLVTVSECLGGLPDYQRVKSRGETDVKIEIARSVSPDPH
ncbi:glycoside hydrolase/deacetylase [Sanghuangporus baumii]|uniref:Glycoside hydrolase/deacetylase n=1 Tax=Sanghuangporus baumii TaxID=108892 RepID=A0A9Q5I4N0_SANBA|nr:glycoside hydrolase/deacetylase [Sanghuangporus baumii]